MLFFGSGRNLPGNGNPRADVGRWQEAINRAENRPLEICAEVDGVARHNEGWWPGSLIIPRLGSVLVTTLTLMVAHPLPPVQLTSAQEATLLNVCTLIWPLVLLPWLAGLRRKWRLPGLWLGVVGLYWLQGQPILSEIRQYMSGPGNALLFRMLGSMMLGILLLIGLSSLGKKRWRHVLLYGAVVVGYGLLLIAT